MLGRKQQRTDEIPVQETTDPGFDISIQDFLIEHADPQKGYVCRVFRTYSRPGSRDKNAFLQTWRDQVPEYEEIAAAYGPGTYRINLIYSPPGKGRTATSRTVHIDPNWAGAEQAGPGSHIVQNAANIAQLNGQAQTNQMLQMFGMFLDTLGQFAGDKKGNGGGSFAALAEMQKAMGESLIANYQTQSKLVDRVVRDRLDVGTDEPEIDGAAPFVVQAVQWCISAWQKYGSQILASPKMAGGFLKPKAQGIPQIDYALSHPEEYAQLYTQFAERSGAPTNAIDEFIHALGYPTPAELKAQATAEGTTEATQ